MVPVRRRTAWIATCLALALSACETAAEYEAGPAPGAPPGGAPRPTFTVGDEFWFDTGAGASVVEVYAGQDRDLLVFERYLENETRYYSPDLALVEIRRPFGEDEWIDPDDGALQFPLEIGKTWTRSYRVRSSDQLTSAHRTRRCEVLDIGRTTTPAGRFTTYRIACTLRALGEASIVEEESFYAPDVGRIVLRRIRGGGADLVLIEVSRAP